MVNYYEHRLYEIQEELVALNERNDAQEHIEELKEERKKILEELKTME